MRGGTVQEADGTTLRARFRGLGRLGRGSRRRRWAMLTLLLVVWAAAAVTVTAMLFFNSSRSTVIASHDADLHPTYDGKITVRSGPFLPDLRMESTSRFGVEIVLGKTEAESTDELAERYALIATHPEGQVTKVAALVKEMALSAALRGAVIALVPVAIWFLLGPKRRRALVEQSRGPAGIIDLIVLAVLAALVWQPWNQAEERLDSQARWERIGDYLAGVPVPSEVRGIEVRTDVTTNQTRRLLLSVVDTYDRGRVFYEKARAAAADLELREPAEDETVALLVADRHDNIGMDPVARAIADRAGATAVLNAGDDTSTGEAWEAFSIDAAQEAYGDLDRYHVAGNHDHGEFVRDYFERLGWTTLAGDIVTGPGDSTLLGAHDPRSSGLGTWRNETSTTFAEQVELLAEAACESEDRIGTLLVHDANIGREALARGCVDLVVGGHHHTRSGPDRVDGENGHWGYTYTNGTTGGAAYAIAVGSKPRRPAEVSLITYRDGRPVGIQWVVLKTNGQFEVGEYVELELSPIEPEQTDEPEQTESGQASESTSE